MITHCPIAHIKFRNYAKIIFDLGFTNEYRKIFINFTEKFIGTTHEKLSVLQTTSRLVNTRFHQEIREKSTKQLSSRLAGDGETAKRVSD